MKSVKLYKYSKLLFIFVLLIGMIGGFTVIGQENSSRGCEISVSSDQHVAPAAELASTKGYPDIIKISNSLISVTSIPNRGRLIFDYTYKPAGKSFTHTDTSPMPLDIGGDYFLEFGGFYTNYPWNERANQPYDMEYELNEGSSDACSISIFREGEDFPLNYQTLLTVKPEDPTVYIDIKLVNRTDKPHSIDWADNLVVSTKVEEGPSPMLELPADVNEVQVGRNDSQWMGEEGETVTWPQDWANWVNYESEGYFSFPLTKTMKKSVSVYYPGQEIRLVKEWTNSEGYGELRVLSWGPSYEDFLGAYPGFLISNKLNNLTVQPGEKKEFEIKIYAAESN